jgi:hypothetical protein
LTAGIADEISHKLGRKFEFMPGGLGRRVYPELSPCRSI